MIEEDKNEELLDTRIIFRLFLAEKKEIDRIIEENPHKYNGQSHFIRCAIISKIREEKYNRGSQ